ncbi:MAG: DUF1549 domain-containing protein [Planctomycetota bacterium]|nr:MAG: DUF1549 domain-containing protein [Planctomycetota bacterium]
MMRNSFRLIVTGCLAATLTAHVRAEETVLPPASERFQGADIEETPDFQRHLVPLLGKLGCNGRACHGSFQGRGDLRLSLFGYDFEMDHAGLIDRVDTDDPASSYALHKPTLLEPHEGGRRMEIGGWEYNLFLNWIKGGARPVAADAPQLVDLEVSPAELRFSNADEEQQLRAIAVWSDGTREDVTCLSRYQTNDETICGIDQQGRVTSGEACDTHVVVFYDNAVVPIPVMRPVSDQTGDRYPQVAAPTRVDELVTEKLAKLGIVPSESCTDAEFLRRVSLDIAGTLPSEAEVRQFLADESPDKRARKIDELLETPAYAAWWTTKLCDWTGNSDQQLNNVSPDRNRPARDWYEWILTRVADNTAYDDLVEGIVVATSREDGEDYRAYSERMSALYHAGSETRFADLDGLTYYWARRNFRQPEDRAIGFAYTFMGTRIQCAQCHKHPFDVWTQNDFQEFQRFFTQINYARNGSDRQEYRAMIEELGLQGERGGQLRRKLQQALNDGQVVPFPELVVRRPGANNRRRRNRQADNPQPQTARLLGSAEINLTEIGDPRTALMDWLRNDEKQLFARAFVNRVWANYFGRGIVEPTDDLSKANPPSNGPLFDYLAAGFVENDYDMKWLHREICNSATYQRSWRPNETNAGDERNFSRAVPRRLPAEAAYDALVMATASDDRAETFLTDLNGRALAIPGVPRRNRRNDGPDYALTIFGRSLRENNCDCERSSEASLLQTVFLRNDEATLEMIDRPDGWVNQVTRQVFGSDSQPQQRRDGNNARQQQRRLERLQTNLKRAQDQGNENRVRQVRRQIRAIRQQMEQSELVEVEQEFEGQTIDDATLAQLVESAYLKTVNRKPNDHEQQVSAAFVKDADNPIEGLRGLVWTLINTKEFIVNH